MGLGLNLNPDLVVGLTIPVVAVLVLTAVRRARKRILAGDNTQA